MGYVVYEIETQSSVRLVEKESTAKGMVTKNNKQLVWQSLKGQTYNKPWSYCSWSEFESIAKAARKPGYYVYHEF